MGTEFMLCRRPLLLTRTVTANEGSSRSAHTTSSSASRELQGSKHHASSLCVSSLHACTCHITMHATMHTAQQSICAYCAALTCSRSQLTACALAAAARTAIHAWRPVWPLGGPQPHSSCSGLLQMTCSAGCRGKCYRMHARMRINCLRPSSSAMERQQGIEAMLCCIGYAMHPVNNVMMLVVVNQAGRVSLQTKCSHQLYGTICVSELAAVPRSTVWHGKVRSAVQRDRVVRANPVAMMLSSRVVSRPNAFTAPRASAPVAQPRCVVARAATVEKKSKKETKDGVCA